MRKTVIICDHTGKEGAVSLSKCNGRDELGDDSWTDLDIHPTVLAKRINEFINRAGNNSAGEELWEYLCKGRKTTSQNKIAEGVE